MDSNGYSASHNSHLHIARATYVKGKISA